MNGLNSLPIPSDGDGVVVEFGAFRSSEPSGPRSGSARVMAMARSMHSRSMLLAVEEWIDREQPRSEWRSIGDEEV
jgi:hypothetical protein